MENRGRVDANLWTDIHRNGPPTHRRPARLSLGALAIAGVLLLLLAPTASATVLPESITENMTLTPSGNPYTGNATIEAGVTVNIQPGVELAGGTLTVKGTLAVEGTSSEPVVFRENTHSALIFEAGSGASVVNYADLIKAGHEYCCPNLYAAIAIKGSSPTISNSTLTEAQYIGIEVTKGGSPDIANNSIYKSTAAGIYYSAGEKDTGEVNIHGNTIEGGGGAGISVGITGTGVNAKSLSGNTITGKEGVGLSYSGPDIPGGITENTLSGNKTNLIELAGTVAHSSTWSKGTEIKLTGDVTVASGVTLTITHGVHFQLGSSKFSVKGTLNVEGTSSESVVFNEGSHSALVFEPGSGASVVNYAEVLKAGYEFCCPNLYAAIAIKGSSPTISNSSIIESKYIGIEVSKGGSPDIANNLISKSKATGISYSAGEGDSGEVNIHGNTVKTGSGAGISVGVTGSTVNAKALSGNTITSNEGVGLSYSGPDIPGGITENTLSGNKTNIIEIGGTVAHSSTWNNGGTQIKVKGEGVTVASGVTLKITHGVYMTLVEKFTVKGTLNVEGTSSEPVVFSEGSHSALVFEPGSGASVINYAEVLKAGYIYCCGNVYPAIAIKGSSPTISNSNISESQSLGIEVTKGGSPEIVNDRIYKSKATAIYYSAGEKDIGEVNIHGNAIEGGGGAGISVGITGTGVNAKSLSGNTVTGKEGVGLSYSGPDIPGGITENTLVGNKTNIIEIAGTVAHSSTWNNGGVEIKLSGDVTVASAVTLHITHGVRFQMGSSKFTVNGTLDVEGTSSERVVFNEGTHSALVFEPGSGASVVSYAEVLKAGHEYCCPNLYAAIAIKGSSPTISHSNIIEAQYIGIEVSKGGSPEIANNFIYKSKAASIYYNAGKENTGEVNIHDNAIEGGGGAGITASIAGTGVTAKALKGNVILGKEGIGLYYNGPDIPGDITENTLVGNKTNVIEIGGTVAHSSTWNNGGVEIKVNGEGVTVAPGVTLKITHGVYMTLNSKVTVKGTLTVEGTASEPVVFNEGSHSALAFEPGSGASVVNYAEVRKAGHEYCCGNVYAAVAIRGSSPTITNSTLRESGAPAIAVTESGSPRIEWDRFRKNPKGLTYSGTGSLSAPNNDWGCANGPQPAGCGDSVSSTVQWKPAVQLPELGGSCFGKETQCGEGADPVSLATGQLSYSHRDLLLTNKSSVSLEFTRSYDSGNSTDTGLGPGWSQTGLASAMELASGEVLVLRQDGRQDVFYKTETGYKAPSGVTDSLAKVEGTFQLTTLDQTVYRFDASGRIASITDAHGLKTTYAYNAEGRLATITDPSGQTLTFAYNGSNHITSVKDSTGREVKFAYSAAGDLETATDALGGVTKYAYDSQHRITSITDPRGNVILKNTYDSQGRITEQRDGLEDLWKLAYGSGETTVTEPQGGKITYGFDSQNRVVSETDQLGNKTTTVYDSAGNVSEVIRPGGAKWTFGHDLAGNLTSVKDPEGGERKYEYDSKNRLVKFTDARGDSWSYEWSASNDLTKITNPEGGESTLTYNESGQPLSLTDADKHKTEFGWDARGNRLSVTDPLGHKTSLEYNSRNYLTAKTLPGLKAETFERDALGDLLARTTPEGHTTKYAYDANGLPTQITDPAEGVWKIAYNAMERPITYTDPLEQQASVAYNGDLLPTKLTNRRGKETTYGYDLANRLTEVHAPDGGNWTFGYDARGNRTSIVDPRENKTTYEYDSLDRMKKASEPLEATTEYGYDANGDLTSVKDPRGNTTSYGYDKLGRLTEVKQPLEKTTSFAYDGVGNMLSRATAVGTVEYGYDAANRLTKVNSGESTLRSFGYDAANRLTEATDAEGHKIEVGYTEEGRVASMNDGRGQSLTRSYNARGQLTKQVDARGTLEYGYDKLGRLTSLTDPQGKASSFAYDAEGDLTEVKRPGGIVTTNIYDNAGRLSEGTTKAGEPPAVLEALKYSYDSAGNLVKRIDSRLEQETSYAYDALNRLTEFNPPGEGSTSYAYDAAGNRTEAGGTTYTYNALNQLTESSDGTTYGYDGAGRLTTKAKESEENTYTWDPLDHLAKVEGPTETASYAYDALERLSERAGEAGTQVFHYGDLGDLATFDANGEGKTTTSYVHGNRGLLEQRSGEVTSYPLADSHGDVTAMVNAAGEVTSRQSYDPWGAQLSGPSLEMGYLGAQERRTDPASGLIQMGARSYSPALGRFLTEDPVYGHLGIGASVNRLLYVWDNPLNRYDLNGRDVCVPTPWGGACAEEAAEDAGNLASEVANGSKEMVESWAEDPLNFGDPRELVSSAQEYWVQSESPLSYPAGSVVSMIDLAVNPDRLSYYMKYNHLPGKQQLEDCYKGGHPARTIGGLLGGIGGFGAGVKSAADLGPRAVGVGGISGAAGSRLGGGIGVVGGCGIGVIAGLVG